MLSDPQSGGRYRKVKSCCARNFSAIATIFLSCDIKYVFADGFKFFLSANNVILCPGNEDGILPPKYFKAVYQRHPSELQNIDLAIK